MSGQYGRSNGGNYGRSRNNNGNRKRGRNNWIKDPSGKHFINPYNFVGLGRDVGRTIPTDGPLTGRIQIRLVTKTPLAIPDAAEAKTELIQNGRTPEEHKRYPFFRVGDVPMIPGSQLRGMLRSVYEALSNSCFSVSNNNILSARHTNPGKEGLIQYQNGKWHLYEAEIEKDTSFKALEDEAYRTWYDIRGNAVKEVLFKNEGREIHCVNLERAIENYQEVLKLYEKPVGGGKNKFLKHQNKITYGITKDGKCYPVFYEIVDDGNQKYVYLSPAQIGRYVFDNRLDDLLGSHVACAKQGGKALCKACALFGTIRSTDEQSIASRIRIADGTSDDFGSMGFVTLKELAGSKTTSVEFYAKRPGIDAKYWSYDYKMVSDAQTTRNVNFSKKKCPIELRGRKFYWHHPSLKPGDYQTPEKTKRNQTVELCGAGCGFHFDLYFERITQEQLHELVWAITLGENQTDGQKMHKLGHGKPLGLGSVKLVVEGIETRQFDPATPTYQIAALTPEEIQEMVANCPFSETALPFRELMRLADFYSLSQQLEDPKRDVVVSYPIGDNGKQDANAKASHQWFIANRSIGKDGTSTRWSVKYTLPTATQPNLALPALRQASEGPTYNRQQNGNKPYQKR